MAVPEGVSSDRNRDDFTSRVNVRDLVDYMSHLLTPQQREELQNLEQTRGNTRAAVQLLEIMQGNPTLLRRAIDVLPRMSQQGLANELQRLLPAAERSPPTQRIAVEPAAVRTPTGSPTRRAAAADRSNRIRQNSNISSHRSPRTRRRADEPTQPVRTAASRIQEPRGDHESVASTSRQLDHETLIQLLRPVSNRVPVSSMPESVRSRVRSKMEATDTGLKLSEYIRDKIDPDELLPHLRATFPSSVVSNIERTQRRHGEQQAMNMLLDAVYRYDDGLSMFGRALERSGHTHSGKYYADILEEARREYREDEQKIEEAKNYNRNNNNRCKRGDNSKRRQPPRSCAKDISIKRLDDTGKMHSCRGKPCLVT